MATRDEAVAPRERERPRMRRRAGWRVVARKELADHLLSARFLILLGVIGLFAMLTIYAVAGGIRELAPQASGQPAVFLALFTFRPDDVPLSFLTVVGLLTPLLGIAFGFDAVSGERSEGTLPRLVSQPIHRDDVINGKFAAGLVAIGLLLTIFTMLVSAIGMLRLGIVPSGAEVARLVIWLLVTFVYVSFWLGLSCLCSVVFRRAATSAIVGIAAWLVLAVFGALFIGLLADAISPVPDEATAAEVLANLRTEENIGRIFPANLYDDATIVLLNPLERSTGIILLQQLDFADLSSPLSLEQSLLLAWPQTVALVAITVICFAAAYIQFMRQEIRA